MSALAEAIRRGRPRSDLGAASPFAGLRRRHANTIDVIAQSVAATAPAGVLLVHPGALYSRSGSIAFLDVLLTVVLVVAVGLVIGVFARRISSTGSLYTFATRGLGPYVGLMAGSALGIGYLAIAMNTLASGSRRLAGLISGAQDAPALVVVAVMLGFAVIIAVVIARGLRMSTRLLLVIETIAVLMVLALSVAALSITRWDLALLIPQPQHVSPDAIMAGVAFALIGFVGFESGAALGPETRRPFAAVPRAIMICVGATATVMLVGTAAQLSLVAEAPGAASLESVVGLSHVTELIVGVSFLACSLAMTNAATRVAFALSREGVIGEIFGRTSSRGVPAAGGVILTAAVAGVPALVYASGGSAAELRTVTSPASTLGFVIAYALICLAAPFFLARIGELTWQITVLCALPFVGLCAVVAFYLGSAAHANPVGLASALVILVCIAAGGMVRVHRRPGLASRLGMHDWPVAADCIDGAAERRP